MANTIRAFVAIELPIIVRNHLETIRERLHPYELPLRWVKTGNIHLTLKFLGDIEAEDLTTIEQALNAAAENQTPLALTAKGIGVFPGIRRPSVLWGGLIDHSTGIDQLQAAVETRLHEIGYRKDARPFRAHLTIGRFKGRIDGRRLQNALNALSRYESPPFTVRDFFLFQSRLKPHGAEHTKRIRISLGNRSSGS